MRVTDEPIEKFYPRCILCGEVITEKGYLYDGDNFYCTDCLKEIDGTEVAEERRYASFENAQETFNG